MLDNYKTTRCKSIVYFDDDKQITLYVQSILYSMALKYQEIYSPSLQYSTKESLQKTESHTNGILQKDLRNTIKTYIFTLCTRFLFFYFAQLLIIFISIILIIKKKLKLIKMWSNFKRQKCPQALETKDKQRLNSKEYHQ